MGDGGAHAQADGIEAMSFFGSAFSAIAPIVGGFFGGPAGAAIGSAIGGAVNQASQANQIARAQAAMQGFTAPSLGLPDLSLAAPAVPVRQTLPQGVLANITGPLAAQPGAACPAGFHLDKRSRSRCVRNRRMNPLNGRAATRAIRRIKGARKMLQKIERSLPRARARAVPRHGHRVRVDAT